MRAWLTKLMSLGARIVLDATAGSDAGIDVVSSEYATIAAEQTALENLAREVAEQMVTGSTSEKVLYALRVRVGIR